MTVHLFYFLDYTYRWKHTVFLLLCLTFHLGLCLPGPFMVLWTAKFHSFLWLRFHNTYLGEDMEKREPLCTIAVDINCYSHYGKSMGFLQKNWYLFFNEHIEFINCTWIFWFVKSSKNEASLKKEKYCLFCLLCRRQPTTHLSHIKTDT